MHDAELHGKFIEFRSLGWSFNRISAELKVPRSTLAEWGRKFQFQIQNRRAEVLDDMRDRILGTFEVRVDYLVKKSAEIEEELRSRDLSELSMGQLLSMSRSVRKELADLIGKPVFAKPVQQIPTDEIVERIQEWTA